MVDDLTTQLLELFEASNDGRLLLGGVGKLEQDGLSRSCTAISEDRVEIIGGFWEITDVGSVTLDIRCFIVLLLGLLKKPSEKYQLTIWSRRVEYYIQTIKVLQ
jgi:hypothetical protein